MKVDLPGDQWCEIKDLAELKAKDKIAVERAIVFAQPEDGSQAMVSAAMVEEMQIALLCRVITAWSLPPPVPVSAEVLEDLDIATYNALCEAVTDHMEVVRVVPNRRTPSG